MADNGIHLIETSPGSGKYYAARNYLGIEVSCPNPSGSVLSDNVRNAIRLVVEAIDKQWFRPDAAEIRTVGTAHDTSGGKKDAKHITMTVKPGSKAKHLYILPNNDQQTIDDTDILDNSKPPGAN